MKKLLLALMFCLITSIGYTAPLPTQYIDTDVVGGNRDGTSRANAYKYMQEWENQNLNITGYDVGTLTVYCYGVATDTSCVNSGWITDTTHTITLIGDAHTGIWDTNHYRLSADLDGSSALENQNSNIIYKNIQIKNTHGANSTSSNGVRIISGTNIQFINCIIQSPRYALLNNSTGTTYIINSLLYTTLSNSYDALFTDTAGTIYAYSCTFRGKRNGVYQTAGTVVLKNCYASGDTAAYSGTITQTTCASSDTTAGGTALDSIAYSTDNFTNVTAASEDLHLVSGSALIDVGTDTSGESSPLNFTTDIDGDTRSGTWDIGADEYVAAAAASTPPPFHAIINVED